MQGTIEKQLELLPKTPSNEPEHSRTPEQESWWQAKRAEARKEALELEAIGHQLYPDFVDMLHCQLDRYKLICSQWHESKGHVTPELITRVQLPFVPQPPIRQWSTLAKRRKRLSALHKRMQQKYSFPEWFHQAIQEQVLTNPDYYGVCPLPSESACKYFPPNLRQIAAIEEENNYRQTGVHRDLSPNHQ
jgi:hypothetical protein